MNRLPLRRILNLTVFVAALGYFVDMFDLLSGMVTEDA